MTVKELAKRHRLKAESVDRLIDARNWTGDEEIDEEAFVAVVARELGISRKAAKAAGAEKDAGAE